MLPKMYLCTSYKMLIIITINKSSGEQDKKKSNQRKIKQTRGGTGSRQEQEQQADERRNCKQMKGETASKPEEGKKDKSNRTRYTHYTTEETST